jgi:hypothetical protein
VRNGRLRRRNSQEMLNNRSGVMAPNRQRRRHAVRRSKTSCLRAREPVDVERAVNDKEKGLRNILLGEKVLENQEWPWMRRYEEFSSERVR